VFGTSFGKHGKLNGFSNLSVCKMLFCYLTIFIFYLQEWFSKKLNEISNPESMQYLVSKLNTSKTDNNNLPLSLVETLQQLGKDYLCISDDILLYLYLEVSILALILKYKFHVLNV